jgi:hypothetical protein
MIVDDHQMMLHFVIVILCCWFSSHDQENKVQIGASLNPWLGKGKRLFHSYSFRSHFFVKHELGGISNMQNICAVVLDLFSEGN